MALKVEWTPQAEKGLDGVLGYLSENWGPKEIMALERKLTELTERISKYPRIYPASGKFPNVRKAKVDTHNYIVYRIRPRKKVIEVLNFRGYKQRPLT